MISWWRTTVAMVIMSLLMTGGCERSEADGDGDGDGDADDAGDDGGAEDAAPEDAGDDAAPEDAGDDAAPEDAGDDAAPGSFTLSSPAFEPDGLMSLPNVCTDYTDLGISPALEWVNPPEGVASFALTCIDIDGGDWVHWMVWGIDGATRGLEEGLPAEGSTGALSQGVNSFGQPGYGGPCPPPNGVHRYVFTLYALDTDDLTSLDPATTSIDDLQSFVDARSLGAATLTGTFERH